MVTILAFLSLSAFFAPKAKDYLVIECDDSYCWVTAPGDTPSDQQIGVIYKVDGQWALTPGTAPPTSEERKEQQEEKQEQPKDDQLAESFTYDCGTLGLPNGSTVIGSCGAKDDAPADPTWKPDPQADGFACLMFTQGKITVTDCGSDEVVSEPRVVKIGLFEDRD